MSVPSRLTLFSRRWTPLPGTPFEVLRHGKTRAVHPVGVEIERTGDPRYPAGWDLTPVRDSCYVRAIR